MSKIKVLEDDIINKIAAGEVVEKPASVVKELVENAIDAESTEISVEIKSGGITYIRVSDNGCGINKNEIEVAFLRHATSKISSENDLNKINTLGFRGEALASIACISKTEIITKTKDEVYGYKVIINGGNIIEKSETGAPNGTIITVSDLFYNTPARYKFLKSESREGIYITDLMENMALSHPKISFKYKVNEKIIFSTNGDGSLKGAILSVFGREIGNNIIEVKNNATLIGIEGYIGNSKVAKNSRTQESLFINGRYVKNKTINAAIETAYKSMITINKFPIYFIHIFVNPEFIDVNVHPSKMEVKFQDEQLVFKTVYKYVRDSLVNKEYLPDYSSNDDITFKPNIISKEINVIQSKMPEINDFNNNVIDSDKKYNDYEDINMNKSNSDITSVEKVNEELVNMDILSIEPLSIVGQIHFTYIIAEGKNDIFIIDQHAAHERIFYEKYLNDYEKSCLKSQMLISPIIMDVPNSQNQIIMESKDYFKKIGFEIEEFGNGSIALRAVPILFGNPDYKAIFEEIINESDLNNNQVLNSINKVIYTMACKSAVKAGDKLNYIEMTELIEKLRHCKNPFTCPHGRPTIIKTSYFELEKRFKRIL